MEGDEFCPLTGLARNPGLWARGVGWSHVLGHSLLWPSGNTWEVKDRPSRSSGPDAAAGWLCLEQGFRPGVGDSVPGVGVAGRTALDSIPLRHPLPGPGYPGLSLVCRSGTPLPCNPRPPACLGPPAQGRKCVWSAQECRHLGPQQGREVAGVPGQRSRAWEGRIGAPGHEAPPPTPCQGLAQAGASLPPCHLPASVY